MRTLKLIISFDGSRYEGWQSQRKDKTLQEVFEKVLTRIFGVKTPIISSSRTDSGVHALAMPAHFRVSSSKLSDAKIRDAINYYLPRDIVVKTVRTVPNDFHARFAARSKLYRYTVWCSKTRPVFEAPYVLWYPFKLDLAAMRRAAKHLKGRHDFSAFKDSGDDDRDPVKTITRIRILSKPPLITVEVEGSGFLRHMVRILVGTLLQVGSGRLKPEAVREILRSKDRRKAGPTIKGHGLTLVRVRY